MQDVTRMPRRLGERHGGGPLPDQVRVRVPAKINLALCVGPRRPDGYHPLGTVFHAVSLFDEVTVRLAPQGRVGVEVLGEGADQVGPDESNLAVRAARLLMTRFGLEFGVEITIRKSIPVAGGMAGGSADGAASLLACSVLWDLDTSPEDLHELAAQLGSDVPFALSGGCALGRGRGDQLVPLLSRGTYHWVLAFSHRALSTPAVFAHFDELGTVGGTDVPPALLAALASGDVAGLGRWLRNDLTGAACDLAPELRDILTAGTRAGALGAVVSGSGPTVAFLAAGETEAMDLCDRVAALPGVRVAKRVAGPVPGARLLG